MGGFGKKVGVFEALVGNVVDRLRAVFHKDVAAVLKDFHNVVDLLNRAEERAAFKAGVFKSEIVALEAKAAAQLAEVERARGVRAKISALVG